MPPGLVVDNPAAAHANLTIDDNSSATRSSGALEICKTCATAAPPKMSPAPVVSVTQRFDNPYHM